MSTQLSAITDPVMQPKPTPKPKTEAPVDWQNSKGYLTVPEVAAILRRCEDTIYRRCAAGTMPHIRIERDVLFSPADLLAYIEARHFKGGIQ